MNEPLPYFIRDRSPMTDMARVVRVVLIVMWLTLLPVGALASCDLCDVGAQINSEANQPDRDARYESCVQAARHRRTVVQWGLGGALVLTVAGVVLMARPAKPGWYRDPLRPPSTVLLRYWDGRRWSDDVAAPEDPARPAKP